MYGLVTPLTTVPVPCVKPVAPHSMFQSVSVFPAVQDKSAVVVDKLDAIKAVGSGHEGKASTTISSKYNSN